MSERWGFVVLLSAGLCLEPMKPLAQEDPELAQEKGFRGFVCDHAGRPLSDARILVSYRHRLESAEDGRFFLAHSKLERDGGPLLFLIQKKQGADSLSCARFVDYVTGRENVSFQLKPCSSVSGRVLSSGGNPIPHATVSALMYVGSLTCHGTMPAGKQVRTDERGRFTVPELYPNTRYMLRVMAPAHERKVTDWIPVGARELCRKLEVTLRDAPGLVEGRVVDEKGEPVVKAKVILGHPCIPDAVCTTGNDGTFRITDLVPGEEVTIAVSWNFRKVKVGTRDIVLVLGDRKK